MISLFYAGNRKVFDGMLLSSLSLVKYCTEPLRVFLLTMDLSDVSPEFLPITEEQRAYLETVYRAVNPESRVTLTDVGTFYRDTLLHAPNQQTQYTPYCFLRLYAARIPSFPDKILYLDTDTVFCGNVRELWDVPLGDAEFAGVRDYYGHRFFGIRYLNSGVLLLNLKQIRETGLFEKSLTLCAEKKIFLPDQTALNRLAKKKKILPRRFNEQHACASDTVIRHFSMTILWFPYFQTRNVKPWETDKMHNVLHIHRFDDILNDYQQRKEHFPIQWSTL